MHGISKFRDPGIDDPVLMEMLAERGLDEVPLFSRRRRNLPARAWRDAIDRWNELASQRDGLVNPNPRPVDDPAAMTRRIKEQARDLGASDVGIAELRPIMINEGAEFGHANIISLIVAEDYEAVLGGALAVETETIRVYVAGAEIATELARLIRDMGYPARADHNGTFDIQAIPALYECGMGELGKHGSLIHREFGAGFRPTFVMTDLPLVADEPDGFGVQDYCLRCNLCTNNCPAEAIPDGHDYVLTDGIKRWLTDVEKCYTASRLRDEYCHICVDVCPYVHKMNGDGEKIGTYKAFMGKRRRAGWRTPQWFLEDEDEVLGRARDAAAGS